MDVKPMEEHKLRAVRYFLRRAGKRLDRLVDAVEEVSEELEDAYMDLGDEWRGESNRGKFLQMMIADGCFLLEVMRAADANPKRSSILVKYEHDDPIFSWHGIQHIKAFVQRDMLMLENQLPLRLLQRIVEVEGRTSPHHASINCMVLNFLLGEGAPQVTGGLRYHPLDIYRKSQLLKPPVSAPRRTHLRGLFMKPPEERGAVPRSACQLSEAGIRFVCSKTCRLDDIHFDSGTLEMPRLELDDSTAYRLHNMMVFEAMHAGTGNEVTSYALFVKDLVDSADDVRLLVRQKIMTRHQLADIDAVVSVFNGLTRGAYKDRYSVLCGVRDDMETHYVRNTVRVLFNKLLAYPRNKYLASPWKLLALGTAILLFLATLVQAVFAVLSYDPNKGKV